MKVCVTFCFLALAVSSATAIRPRTAPSEREDSAQHPHLRTLFDYSATDDELQTEFWHDKAQSILSEKLTIHKQLNENTAKNIILFLGDGMSVHTIAATRAFMGDSNKQVFFEKFPYTGLSKTYAVDERTPDSASTATAYLTGVKGNYGTIGVNAKVQRRNCFAAIDKSTHTESIAKWAQDAGKWAGLVSTARVTHASPAGVYAHTADRDWEYDAPITKDGCSADENLDIARQLVESPVGKDLRVVLGGGRAYFRGRESHDEEGILGEREDGRDLIADWVNDKADKNAHYVWSRKGLNDLDLSKTDYLLGLFDPSHCPYHGDRHRKNLDYADPSLSEMTAAAIKVLSRNDQGYFLFVESGRIDMAHHSAQARKALEETDEFANAIELARGMTNEKDTLIVVTSDHSHTMTINGYPYRRQNILSLAPNLADDQLPFTILSYANGPGYAQTFSSETGRIDLTGVDTTDPEFQFQSTVPLSSETHGGEDVGVFASGPFEHFFAGNYEQTAIPALMAYAANIGPFAQDKLNE
ncbi:alkaline phosphatase [Scaptodrosophila lebanonensis]|uniref:alkaline phosphatase n=1 Tax=Drosophila lebanonensis TaxID=7225 RepID=A0A6J2T8E7_DROLE|nr:alkaline phosphatase [Scaptodrosophila lebanonensis]